MDLRTIDVAENRRRMERGELYHAFTPDLIADRKRCKVACNRFNTAGDVSRRKLIELWNDVVGDTSPIPPEAPTAEEDEDLLGKYPWIDAPICKMDYGYNIKLGEGVYINANCTWVDTCTIEIGARTLVGPNCSFISGSHPQDPFLRNGTNGPEDGSPVKIGEDCWLGASVIVLPGVTIGKGATVGAGSVVTKDVPDFTVVVGVPARILKKVKVSQPHKAVEGEEA